MPSPPKSARCKLAKFHRRSGKNAEPRPRLTAQDVSELAAEMSQKFGWDSPPKDFQLAAVKAQIEGVDMIVQAPTGAGKTALAAGPHLWKWKEKKFTLMVCPLLTLEEEMVQTFDTEFGLKAIAINSKNGACSPLVIQDILAYKYQIILISPEMLQSRMFTDRVLRNTGFMSHILSMFIDEAHCVVHWGADFRKKYGTLGKVRAFFPPGTPVIAVTATLTARVRRTLHSSLHFGQSEAQSRFINKGNDRPNVSIAVRACQHPLNTFADLDFIIPSSLRHPSDIPKTIVYVDHIPQGGDIIDRLYDRLDTHPDLANNTDLARRFQGVIRPFNATMSSHYRSLAMAHFRLGNIRTLVCTEAAGMGCNIPDIDRVVQWKLPATFSHFIQRGGRAARGRGRKGIAILLVEKSAYNTDLVSQPAPSTEAREAKPKRTKATGSADGGGGKSDRKKVREYARAHGVDRGGSGRLDSVPDGTQPLLNPESADEGLLVFVQSTTCRRRIWAQAFESWPSEPVVPCCDICDPSLLNATRPPARPPERRAKTIKRGLPHQPTRAELRKWRTDIYKQQHTAALYDASAILDDDMITTLSSCGKLTTAQISTLLTDKWIFWDKHGLALTGLLSSMDIPFIPVPPKVSKSTAPRQGHTTSNKRVLSPVLYDPSPDADAKRIRTHLHSARRSAPVTPPRDIVPRVPEPAAPISQFSFPSRTPTASQHSTYGTQTPSRPPLQAPPPRGYQWASHIPPSPQMSCMATQSSQGSCTLTRSSITSYAQPPSQNPSCTPIPLGAPTPSSHLLRAPPPNTHMVPHILPPRLQAPRAFQSGTLAGTLDTSPLPQSHASGVLGSIPAHALHPQLHPAVHQSPLLRPALRSTNTSNFNFQPPSGSLSAFSGFPYQGAATPSPSPSHGQHEAPATEQDLRIQYSQPVIAQRHHANNFNYVHPPLPLQSTPVKLPDDPTTPARSYRTPVPHPMHQHPPSHLSLPGPSRVRIDTSPLSPSQVRSSMLLQSPSFPVWSESPRHNAPPTPSPNHSGSRSNYVSSSTSPMSRSVHSSPSSNIQWSNEHYYNPHYPPQ